MWRNPWFDTKPNCCNTFNFFAFKVDKKRHLGNDIVAIVFQDSNTPFCPTLMKTKVTHAYVVVQPMEIDGPTQYKVN